MFVAVDRRRQMAERSPTAAELIEASKHLYVKTEFLKEHRIDPETPRLFKTPSEEELEILLSTTRLSSLWTNSLRSLPKPPPKRSLQSMPLRPSAKSAFHTVQKMPPRPPKTEALRRRQTQLAGGFDMTQSMPSHQLIQHLEAPKPLPIRPQPPPRRSLQNINKIVDKDENRRKPVAPPRRKTTTVDMNQSFYVGDLHSKATSTTNLLTKSTPDLTLDLSMVAASPSTTHDSFFHSSPTESPQSVTPKNSDCQSAIPPSVLLPDNDGTKPPLAPQMRSKRLPPKSGTHLSYPSPDSAASKDSGIPSENCSSTPDAVVDVDERIRNWERRHSNGYNTIGSVSRIRPVFEQFSKQQSNTLRTAPRRRTSRPLFVQELFDSQGLDPSTLREELQKAPLAANDADSEFTSITAQRRSEDDVAEASQQNAERPVSLLEKNARVLRWIHGCSVATTTDC